jgi:serine/threonine-protein kinase HipA
MLCLDHTPWTNSQRARFLLEPAQAKEIISTMTEQVRASWYNIARAQGVNE